MMNRRRWWALLPRQLRDLPADLAAVGLLTVATVLAATLPGVDETPLRIVLGLPFVLFLPGYALIAALFPEAGPDRDHISDEEGADDGRGESNDDRGTPDGSRGTSSNAATRTPGVDDAGIDAIERAALSFGTSIAVVPLVGLVLNFTPWGIRGVRVTYPETSFT